MKATELTQSIQARQAKLNRDIKGLFAMELTKPQKDFLIGLTKLTRDTGIGIGGCGCCGSPFLIDAEMVDDDSSGYAWKKDGDSCELTVIWTSKEDSWDWEHYADKIVG